MPGCLAAQQVPFARCRVLRESDDVARQENSKASVAELLAEGVYGRAAGAGSNA